MDTAFGARLDFVMNQRGLTNAQVAREVGAHTSTVRLWRLSRTEPKPHFKERLNRIIENLAPVTEPRRLPRVRRSPLSPLGQRMIKTGLSIPEIAKMVGCSVGTAEKWARGAHKPQPKMRRKLFAVLRSAKKGVIAPPGAQVTFEDRISNLESRVGQLEKQAAQGFWARLFGR